MERLDVEAGVVGLTTALRLAEARYKNVLVSTKHMPVDSDGVYTSPWLITFVRVSVESLI